MPLSKSAATEISFKGPKATGQRYSINGHAMDDEGSPAGYEDFDPEAFRAPPQLAQRRSSRVVFDDNWDEVSDPAAVVDVVDSPAQKRESGAPAMASITEERPAQLSTRTSSRVVYDDDWSEISDPAAVVDVPESPRAAEASPARVPGPRKDLGHRGSVDLPVDFMPDRRLSTAVHFDENWNEVDGQGNPIQALGAIGAAGVSGLADVGAGVVNVGTDVVVTVVGLGGGAVSGVGSAMGMMLGAMGLRKDAAAPK